MSDESNKPATTADVGYKVMAFALMAGALAHSCGVLKLDTSAIYLAALALAALGFPHIAKFSIGKDGLSFERLSAKLDGMEATTREIGAILDGGVGGRGHAPSASPKSAADVGLSEEEADDDDDPQKGRWGSQSERDGRVVSAEVAPSRIRPDWYTIRLKARSSGRRKPLTGTVTFHLHPTFKQNVVVRPVIDGCATLELLAWGAFTVGVEADGGATKLELDLAELTEAPAAFRGR